MDLNVQIANHKMEKSISVASERTNEWLRKFVNRVVECFWSVCAWVWVNDMWRLPQNKYYCATYFFLSLSNSIWPIQFECNVDVSSVRQPASQIVFHQLMGKFNPADLFLHINAVAFNNSVCILDFHKINK